MARGKKRNRSLLELMDPQRDYRPSIGKTPGDSGAEVQDQGEKNSPAGPAATIAVKPPSEPGGKAAVEPGPKPAVKPSAKLSVQEEQSGRVDAGGGGEPMLALGQGKVKLVLNYPLALMVCFMAVVLFVCAFLVGWKMGRDKVAGVDSGGRLESRLPPAMTGRGPSGGGSR